MMSDSKQTSSYPRVFISYSHDSPEHKASVLELANRLREDGVDAQIDQYEVAPPNGWASWTERQMRESDFVIVVCTQSYVEKMTQQMPAGEGKGVKWEGALLANEIYFAEENRKYVPVLFLDSERDHVPLRLQSSTCHVLSHEGGYDRLFCHLIGRPVIEKPPLGPIVGSNHPSANPQQILEEAYRQKATLQDDGAADGADIQEIQREILQLRRRLREGVQVEVGQYLQGKRFNVVDRIGQGGFATVWKAYDRDRKQNVALKVLHGQYAQDRTRLERFFRGAKRMNDLNHPGIVQVFDERIENDGLCFFSMKYCAGGDLRKAVLSGGLSPAKAIKLIIEIGQALQFAHEQQSIHRDVKPANILLDRGGQACLTDFDLVRTLDSTGGTRTGMLGTVVYAAPEMMSEANRATIHADIYGLGMTAVFALTGADLGFDVVRNAEVIVGTLNTTDGIKEALLRAISWEPHERFPSIAAFCTALEETVRRSQPPPPEPRPKRSSSVTKWLEAKRIIGSVIELDKTSRKCFLDQECGIGTSLRREVDSLLEGLDSTALLTEDEVSLGSMVGRRVGAYRMVRLIGRGGMGEVYLAERADDIYDQRVAIKILSHGINSPETVRRFRVERQVLADLEHPSIARLLDGGVTEDGRPFLVMEFVDGLPIDIFCEEQRLDVRRRIELFRQVCSAVQVAHQNLIVHRDLKPGNMLVSVEGTPKLLDFGIAKIIEPDLFTQTVLPTRTSMAPMTPAYASPEQVSGRALTTSTDVYSLGVVLYQLLTGVQPVSFSGVALQEQIRRVLEVEPELPSSVADPPIRRRLVGDLDRIVLMALRKEPERRYSSVEQLSDDLQRFLDGKPVSARPATFVYRANKYLNRNKLRLTMALLLLSNLIMALVLLGFVI